MIIFFIAAWAILAFGFMNMGMAWPLLMLPALPLLASTVIHICGYAAFQDDRDQLDSVLDMFGYHDKWKPLPKVNGEQIPGRMEVLDYKGDIYVKLKVGNGIENIKCNRAYAARFRRKMDLLKDHRQMQAIVQTCRELEA